MASTMLAQQRKVIVVEKVNAQVVEVDQAVNQAVNLHLVVLIYKLATTP